MNTVNNPVKLRDRARNFYKYRTGVDHTISSLSRFIIGGFFVYSALNNFMNLFVTSNSLAIPAAVILVALGAGIKLFLGLCIALRFHTRYAAMALVVYMVIVSLILYGPQNWAEVDIYKYIFMRNLAIIGGLLFIYSHSRSASLWQEEWIPKGQREMIRKNLNDREPPHPSL